MPSTPALRPAASPTACSSGGPNGSTRWTWGTASSTPACGRTNVWWCSSGSTCAPSPWPSSWRPIPASCPARWWWPTSPSFHCVRCCPPCAARWRPLGPTSSCWSSPSSRRGGRRCPRARASCATPTLWSGALEGVTSALTAAGTGIVGVMASPLTGAAGNVEFLVHARKGATSGAEGTTGQDDGVGTAPDVAHLLVGALAEAEAAGGARAGASPAEPGARHGDRHLSRPPRPARRAGPGQRHGGLAQGSGRRGAHPALQRAGPGRRRRGRARPRHDRPGRFDRGGQPGGRRHLPAHRAHGHGHRRARCSA